MNRQLLDPHESDIPERCEDELFDWIDEKNHREARCLSFNRRGTLLATGCTDGVVVLWDFDTRSVVKRLIDESEPSSSVQALAWSANGRRVVAGDDRGRVRVWDVESGDVIHRTVFDSPCLNVQICPRDASVILACPNQGVPSLIYMGQVSVFSDEYVYCCLKKTPRKK